MGFFAGRLNNVPVLSLNTKTGGDVNQHVNPDDSTIFHSSMPHVFADVYEVAVSRIGNNYANGAGVHNRPGYWVGNIPAAVQSILNNTPGRVVLTELVFDVGGKEYSKLMQGHRTRTLLGQTHNAQVSTFQYENTFAATGLSRDINVCAGFYNPSDSNQGEIYSVGFARAGDRTITNFVVFQTLTGEAPANHTLQSFSFSNGGWADDAWKESGESAQSWFDTSKTLRLNAWNTGATKVYVTNDAVSSAVGLSGLTGNQYSNMWKNSGIGNTGSASLAGIFKEAPTIAQGYSDIPTKYGTPYAMHWKNAIPTKIRFLVTNLQYNGSNGFSVLTNPFTGTDIKISKTEFIIRGKNLANMGSTVMLNQVATGTVPNRNDMRATTCNQSWGSYASVNAPMVDIPLFLSSAQNGETRQAPAYTAGTSDAGGSSVAAPPTYQNEVGPGSTLPTGDVINHKLSYYNFNGMSSWSVNSNTATIGNASGDIWSRSQLPLKLFSGRTASVEVGSTLPQTLDAGTHVLATMNLGLDTSTLSTVVIATHMLDTRFQFPLSGCHFDSFKNLKTGAQTTSYVRVYEVNPNINNYKLDILQLQVGRFVPISINLLDRGARMVYDLNGNYRTVKGKASITFGLVKQSNGTVQVVAIYKHNMDFNALPEGYRTADKYVYLPKMRITVQRLT